MGSFYTSHTLKGPSREEVVSWLGDRPAYVSKSERSFVTVLDEACESQDGAILAALGASLSEQFKCPVLAVLNHDDDILYFELYENGEKSDEYNSTPAYFNEDAEDDAPCGGDATRLASAFGAVDPKAIESVLRRADYTFASERHLHLAAALGVPEFSVAIGYGYAAENDPRVVEGGYVST
jgi:hypothetical protein